MSETRGVRVLMVDDEPMIRNVFRRWLERAGMIVVEASSAIEACVILEDETTFDVLLTDINMPGLSGRELIEWVRARLPRLPIVVISAHPEALLGIEADEMLAKPVTGRQIEAAIGEAIARRRS